MGHSPPVDTVGEDIQRRAHEVVEAVLARGADEFTLALVERFAQERFHYLPLLRRRVGWIRFSGRHTPIIPHSTS